MTTTNDDDDDDDRENDDDEGLRYADIPLHDVEAALRKVKLDLDTYLYTYLETVDYA